MPRSGGFTDNGGGAAHVRGQRVCGNVLYLPLNSAANLKLLLKKILIFLKKGDDAD